MTIKSLQQMGLDARQASTELSLLDSQLKNKVLHRLADSLINHQKVLQQANQLDIEQAKAKNLSPALVDRLVLSDKTIATMVSGLKQVAALDDPIGEITDLRFLPSGIQVGQMRVPLGVVGMIYESRPNVTIEAASLCLKSGNAVILRGGSEAIHSNRAIAECIEAVLINEGAPKHAVQLVTTTDRDAVSELIQMPEFVDVIIPRGGKSLIEKVSQQAKVPVIKHLDGVCHVYIDEYADKEKALAVALNAKTQRYGTCNTMETLLIAESVAQLVLPDLVSALMEKKVELRGCEKTRVMFPSIKAATELDWHTEYLAPILSVKIVSSLGAAIEHINHFGSHHTDTIITENYTVARQFLRAVDSSSVMVNASTRFADGFEYGLGAEMGISTDKFHARGPVGLKGLTSQKYIVLGNGHIRT